MNWWAFALSAGIATSSIFILNYYLPNLEKLKNKLISDGVNVKRLPMFKMGNIITMSIVNIIVFTILSPFLAIAILFSSKDLKEKVYENMTKRAMTNEI